jgi:hypothetical protein
MVRANRHVVLDLTMIQYQVLVSHVQANTVNFAFNVIHHNAIVAQREYWHQTLKAVSTHVRPMPINIMGLASNVHSIVKHAHLQPIVMLVSIILLFYIIIFAISLAL